MKTYFAPWESAVESWADTDGKREPVKLGLSVTVYEPADTVPSRAQPLRELLAKHIDPATGLITLRKEPPLRATMDPELLRDVAPDAIATLGIRFIVTGPAVESPACEVPHAPSCGPIESS